MTAAHCFGLWKGYDIYIGSTRSNGNDATDTIKGEFEIVHPRFNYVTLENDVLLVKLVSPSSAPPAETNSDPSVPADGGPLTIVGFGHTEKGVPSTILLTAES